MAHLFECLVIWVVDPTIVFIHKIYIGIFLLSVYYIGQSRIVGKLQQAGGGEGIVSFMKKIRQNNSQENKDEKEKDVLFSPWQGPVPANVITVFIKINPTLQAATFV